MTQTTVDHNRNRRKKYAGALLLDLMLAIFVCTFVLISAVSLITTAVAASESSKYNTIAYNAARQAVENLRQYKNAKIVDGTYTDLTAFGPVPQLAELRNPTSSMTVSTFRKPVKMVTVTVTFQAGTTGQRTVVRRVTGLVSPRGVTP